MPKGFQHMQEAFKSWFDDFVVYAKTEDKLTTYLEILLSVCGEYNFTL